jgi:SAM-dependent methyltransferase
VVDVSPLSPVHPPGPARPPFSLHVAWHDIECGAYEADLCLWSELAAAGGDPVLEIGAGTGRVALSLARDGHVVWALDREAELLAALAERARGLDVHTVVGDATGFDLGATRLRTILVPMQTVQLLAGPRERAGLLASVRRHLEPGGLVAFALADELEPFHGDFSGLPAPDVGHRAGWRLVSQPVAVEPAGAVTRIERVRELVSPHDERSFERDVVELARLDAAALEAEAADAGLAAAPRREIAATEEHVASTVVVLRG